MDWELVVAINVMALSLVVLVLGLVNRQRGSLSMHLLHALVLVAGGTALYLGFGHVGTLVAAIFMLLILPPVLLLGASDRAYMMAQFPAAARYARLAAALHPAPAMRLRARELTALASGSETALEELR